MNYSIDVIPMLFSPSYKPPVRLLNNQTIVEKKTQKKKPKQFKQKPTNISYYIDEVGY
jgi:hypothetical protein